MGACPDTTMSPLLLCLCLQASIISLEETGRMAVGFSDLRLESQICTPYCPLGVAAMAYMLYDAPVLVLSCLALPSWMPIIS